MHAHRDINRSHDADRPRAGRDPRGFSIPELLVVIAIIGIIVALVIPAVGGARTAARRAQSNSLQRNLLQAAQTFELDFGRLPGFFPQGQMGSSDNGSATGTDMIGFTQTENVLLDLMGQAAIVGMGEPNAVEVGPNTAQDDNIFINPTLIGADDDAYFTPPLDILVQLDAEQQFGDEGLGHISADADQDSMPDLVDPFGAPILVWIADRDGVPTATQIEDFATADTSGSAALFYWATNAGYLRSESNGDDLIDLNALTLADGGSFLGADIADNAEDLRRVMAAAYGNPAFPDIAPDEAGVTPNALFPTQPLGGIVVHGAGPDNIILSSDDSGARGLISGVDADNFFYGLSFFGSNETGSRRVDDNNRPESIDLVGEFDDVLVSSQ